MVMLLLPRLPDTRSTSPSPSRSAAMIAGGLNTVGEVRSRERLGGLLRYYHRAA
jgi:hypothetical protein